jgi:hypothetical protein
MSKDHAPEKLSIPVVIKTIALSDRARSSGSVPILIRQRSGEDAQPSAEILRAHSRGSLPNQDRALPLTAVSAGRSSRK